jgi:hypothetical protein
MREHLATAARADVITFKRVFDAAEKEVPQPERRPWRRHQIMVGLWLLATPDLARRAAGWPTGAIDVIPEH